MAKMPKGDFTPGANLTPEQIKAVLSFATSRGKTNDETLANMAAFFKTPQQGMHDVEC